jgi:hypothetical protein
VFIFKPVKLAVHCERIGIVATKNKKTIGTNPNKVQLFKLFKGNLWVGRQALQQSISSEH